jgi:hypothetical protein
MHGSKRRELETEHPVMVTAVKRPAGETRGKVAAGPDAGQMPPRQLPTLQRFSADHLVLELHEDEYGSGDVAGRGRAGAPSGSCFLQR